MLDSSMFYTTIFRTVKFAVYNLNLRTCVNQQRVLLMNFVVVSIYALLCMQWGVDGTIYFPLLLTQTALFRNLVN